jgi:antitoxin component of MazEF toxin-antitoxin module
VKSHIQKWGNSAAVRINKTVLEQFGGAIGDSVSIDLIDGDIVITPVEELTLDDLLDGSPKDWLAMTDEDRQWMEMPSVGDEI